MPPAEPPRVPPKVPPARTPDAALNSAPNPTAPAPVSSIRNIGPASEAMFARAGMHDAGTVRQMGADTAYAALMRAGTRPHFIGYYALVMGLQGRLWNDCKGEEKKALRKRFDALVRAAQKDTSAAPAGIERILNEIGLPDPARLRSQG